MRSGQTLAARQAEMREKYAKREYRKAMTYGDLGLRNAQQILGSESEVLVDSQTYARTLYSIRCGVGELLGRPITFKRHGRKGMKNLRYLLGLNQDRYATHKVYMRHWRKKRSEVRKVLEIQEIHRDAVMAHQRMR